MSRQRTFIDPGLGAKLKECREERGYSQAEVARELGLKHRSSVTKHERGLVPGPELMPKYAKLYNCSTDYLYGLTDKSGRVLEAPAPYGELDKLGRKAIEAFLEFWKNSDEIQRQHVLQQMRLLRGEGPKKRKPRK